MRSQQIGSAKLLALLLAAALVACQTGSTSRRVAVELSWDGSEIALTVASVSGQAISIEHAADEGFTSVPPNVFVRLRGPGGRIILNQRDASGGWWTPWFVWSGTARMSTVEIAPARKWRRNFTVRDLSMGARLESLPENGLCQFQVRAVVSVIQPQLRAEALSPWYDVPCDTFAALPR